MIDLHVHSTFSDGSFTPRELIEKARQVGLKAMALTDHDTTGGVDQFLEACREPGKEIVGIPGVEISADVKRGTMHILGYYLDHKSQPLESALVQIRQGREERNRLILKRLNEAGLALSWEEVASLAGEDVVGRPHFAQAMVTKGYVRSTEDAFESYLKKGKPGYADRFRFSPADSIAAIHSAGGVAVMAHPSTLELDKEGLRSYTIALKDAGLQGIEVYYSEHNPSQVLEYAALARDLGLVATGGSDFHGSVNTGVRLGVGFGNLRVPDEAAESLAKLRRQN